MKRTKKFVGITVVLLILFGCKELEQLQAQPSPRESEPVHCECIAQSFAPPGIRLFYTSLPEGHRLVLSQQSLVIEDLQDSPAFRDVGVFAHYYPEQGTVLIQELDEANQEVKRWRIRIFPVPYQSCGPEQSHVELILD